MRPTLKLLHTADWHLGAKFLGLGARGADQRRRLREVAQDIAELAVAEKVHAVLLAGDCFDSLTPSPESLTAFRRFLNTLAAQNIPVLAIAGTHDLWNPGCFWTQLEHDAQGALILLAPGRAVWERPELGLAVQGVSQEASDRPERPLASLRRLPGDHWQVGMAHAALDLGPQNAQESRFSASEIAATGLDYLAFGHWHGQRECSAQGVTAWYSGPPEMIAADESEAGHVLLIELSAGRPPRVSPRKVGKRRLMRLDSEAVPLETLTARLASLADPNAVLELALSGVVAPELKPDPAEIERALAPHFFHVRVKDLTSLEISPEELDRYPDTTATGRFIRLLQAEIESAEENRRADLRQALQLGLALLEGREVTRWS